MAIQTFGTWPGAMGSVVGVCEFGEFGGGIVLASTPGFATAVANPAPGQYDITLGEPLPPTGPKAWGFVGQVAGVNTPRYQSMSLTAEDTLSIYFDGGLNLGLGIFFTVYGIGVPYAALGLV